MNETQYMNLILPVKDKMFRLAKRILGSVPEAEDAIQETLMKIWIKRSALSSYKNPEAFFMTMVKNYCLDRLKSKQSNHLSIVHIKERPGQDDPVKETEIKQMVERVHDLIEELPEQQKMVMHLRDIEQYELEEIAEIMQMSPGNVRTTLSRARKKIREKLIQELNYEQI